jgi:hypothetical protein
MERSIADPADDSQAPTVAEIRTIGKKHRKMALRITIILCFPAFGFTLAASYFPALMGPLLFRRAMTLA